MKYKSRHAYGVTWTLKIELFFSFFWHVGYLGHFVGLFDCEIDCGSDVPLTVEGIGLFGGMGVFWHLVEGIRVGNELYLMYMELRCIWILL